MPLDVEDNNFFFCGHGKEVNNVLVCMFPQDVSLVVNVDNRLLLAGLIHADEHDGIVVGTRSAKNLEHGRLELNLSHFLKNHIKSFLYKLKIQTIHKTLITPAQTIF